MDRYNYEILGSDWDLYKFAYSDLYRFDNVKYIAGLYPPSDSLKGVLYRIHFNPAVNRIVNLPFKQVWNKTYFKNNMFSHQKPLCFIVFTNWLNQNVGIVEYLKIKFPEAKLVCMLQDLVSTQQVRFSKERFDCDRIKQQFDLVLSFDARDCVTYGFVYHPLVFSSYHGKLKNMPYSDIYMLAHAKNRLNDICRVYGVLKDNGLKINMLLAGVAPEDRKYRDEIIYLESGRKISYEDNLQYVLHTRSILEVMQANGAGFTQRTCEAVCLGKKLLTNNTYIESAPFFNSTYISTFTTVDDIDLDFVKKIKEPVDVDYHYKEKMSPIELLDFIEERL